VKNVTISRHVSIRLSADEWELYADKTGAEAAALSINSAIEEAFNHQGEDRRGVTRAALIVMRQFDDLGALDSEPLRRLDQLADELFP
jgi:hypothetical protein